MAYLTYERYKEIGGILEETAFNRNIDRASLMIDRRTFGRLEKVDNTLITQYLEPLCRDLVEYITTNTVEKAITSRSQSVGSVSESESYSVKTADDYYSDISGLIVDYLSLVCTIDGTPVLYRGAMK